MSLQDINAQSDDIADGGGYGQGSGAQDLTNFMNANDNSFIGVAIQYRVQMSQAYH